MSTEKMREEFEAWSANHDYLGGVELDRAVSGNYADVDMQHAWDSWQASRETLVIEMPKEDLNIDYPSYVSLSEVEDAIHAAGVKTK